MRFATLLRLAFFLTLAVFLGAAPGIQARTMACENVIGTVRPAALPREARDTLQRIRQGGPFPYPRKDGSTFGNYEGRLPVQPRGYYREYTVPTPGRSDRGVRRIIAGGGSAEQTTTPGEYYYTADHYRSFRRIVE